MREDDSGGLRLCFAIGVLAGLRAMTPPLLVARAVSQDELAPEGPLANIGSPKSLRGLVLAAAVELVGDKLPMTPSRTERRGVVARLFTGGLSGACMAPRGLAAQGALAGACGALLGCFGGARLRLLLPKALHLPDFPVALLEDAVCIGGSLAVLQARQTAVEAEA